ncbi:glycoside hydrolase family 3 protein [Thioclava kandeliae]|uniref:beta-N-acetylhexosaminidase n=1 Tax=Thioclava kandeliae TaxID=3070818 RepID=A0ABV1SLF4_9RHOB
MTIYESLKAAPFNLTDAQVADIRSRIDTMPLADRVAQVFFLILLGDKPEDLELVLKMKPGGVTRFFSDDLDRETTQMQRIFDSLPIPPLVSADMEGSHLSFAFGTKVPNQMAFAAVDDPALTESCSALMAREGRTMGVTWSFTPVIDINAAFRSSIVGSRSYGSDVSRIERHALAHIEGLQSNGIAATVKHWPGEGYDDRDQHLVTTQNPLSIEEWQASFGRLYRAAFDAGVLSIMSAHIGFPAYMQSIDPDCGIDAYRPASINPALTTRLLREEMGFNGIVVSDATEMGGMSAWISHREMPTEVLRAGCDVILFSLDPEADMAQVRGSVESGSLPESRLNEAVARVLALKTVVGLLDGTHRPVTAETARARLRQPEDAALAEEAFRRAPTLVKDVNKTLPVSPQTHKRVLIIETGIRNALMGWENKPLDVADMLRAEGFEVQVYDKDTFEGPTYDPAKTDLVLYLMADESLNMKSHIYIDWFRMMGDFFRTTERPWHDIPTVMVGFGHPYFLYDAPRVPTYVNAYSTLPEMQQAVVDALTGKTPFVASSPVDAFCGQGQARY